MKTIRRYGDPTEAGFAQSILANAGIEAVLADEFAGSLGPQFVPWGMRLQVPEADVERALEILDQQPRSEADASDAPADQNIPAEHEAPSPENAESENPDIVCPTCGAGWALTGEEAAQPSFTCADCGAIIPMAQPLLAPIRTYNSGLSAFLPRSDSKWVFILVMVAYNLMLQAIFIRVMSPFVGSETPFRPHGWNSLVYHLANSLLFYPVWQTLVLVGIIELFRAIRAPVSLQVLIPAILVCSTDGYRWWPHAFYSFAGFAIFALSYLYWRPASWRTAAAIAIAIHATFNATVALRDVFGTIESERVSRQLTGDASRWERADAIYHGHWTLRSAKGDEEEIKSLQSAIAIYPYDPNYYLTIGLAYEGAGRLSEAEAAFRKAIALGDVEYVWKAWDNLSFVLGCQKRFREALDAAHHALLGAPLDKQAEIEAQIEAIAPKVNGTFK